MATRAEVVLFRQALQNLSALAKRDLARIWAPIAGADFAEQRVVLDDLWPDLIGTYGDMGVTVAADMLDEWLGDPELVMVRPVDPPRAAARMRWALGAPNPLGNLQSIVDELVKQPARRTVQRTAEASDAAWARVPGSSEPCAFCIMLASRGAVYRSEAAALLNGGKFHGGDCRCAVVAVRRPEDLPDGYDPDGLYDRYRLAADQAGSTNPRAVTAALREIEGLAH